MDLASYRKELGLSQESVALALGVKSKGYISEIENGEKPASLKIALKIEQWSGGRVKAATLNADAADLAKPSAQSAA